MTTISPFLHARFEYEGEHFYHLPPKLFAELEQPKPVYLFGTRGSGKTTLLKALCWEERLSNSSLRNALDNTPFASHYIGVYTKLPEIQLGSFDSWLAEGDGVVYGSVLGFYLDVVAVDLLANSISELLACGELDIPPEREIECVANWLGDFPKLPTPGSNPAVKAFGKQIGIIRTDLEELALSRADPRTAVERYPIGQIGSFAKSVARKMGEFCDSGDTRWHFKICMDEGECLNGFQRLVMNTFVRVAEWPLFPVVSFVTPPEDRTKTLIPGLTLQNADKSEVDLDSLPKGQFRAFANGVATVRIRGYLKDPEVEFDCHRLLGGLDLNRILCDLLGQSEAKFAGNLLAAANELARRLASAKGIGQSASNEVPSEHAPPVYQAYLVNRLELDYPGSSDRRALRRQESRQLRKKMVAAYLSIFREAKAKYVRYASADMVLGISDNCIREFLSQIHEIYVGNTGGLREFLAEPVPFDAQYQALRTASLKKSDSMPNSGAVLPVESGRVVRGLARITARLQCDSQGNQHLNAPERGRFVMHLTDAQKKRYAQTLAVIEDAADAGFLKVLDKQKDVWTFQVHASLAPAYGFSYRGAYSETRISVHTIEELRSQETEHALKRRAEAIAGKLTDKPGRPLLEALGEHDD